MPITSLILDMDGVLWRGGEPLGDLPALFARLRALGISFVFVTNNATRTVEDYVARLRRFGIEVEPWQVLNSALAAAEALRQEFPHGAEVYVFGEKGLKQTLADAGFRIANPESERLADGRLQSKRGDDGEDEAARAKQILAHGVDAVVAALNRHCNYYSLATAALLIRCGALFIATNPDRTFPIPEGKAPGAGALVAALEAATDVRARVVGKPQPFLFQLALRRLGSRPDETLVVGDRLETDIAGGQAANCRTALVLSGVTTKEQAMAWEPSPDLIAPDLTAVVNFLERERSWQGTKVVG